MFLTKLHNVRTSRAEVVPWHGGKQTGEKEGGGGGGGREREREREDSNTQVDTFLKLCYTSLI